MYQCDDIIFFKLHHCIICLYTNSIFLFDTRKKLKSMVLIITITRSYFCIHWINFSELYFIGMLFIGNHCTIVLSNVSCVEQITLYFDDMINLEHPVVKKQWKCGNVIHEFPVLCSSFLPSIFHNDTFHITVPTWDSDADSFFTFN